MLEQQQQQKQKQICDLQAGKVGTSRLYYLSQRVCRWEKELEDKQEVCVLMAAGVLDAASAPLGSRKKPPQRRFSAVFLNTATATRQPPAGL